MLFYDYAQYHYNSYKCILSCRKYVHIPIMIVKMIKHESTEPPGPVGTKYYSNGLGHMVPTPTYDKTFNVLSSEPKDRSS